MYGSYTADRICSSLHDKLDLLFLISACVPFQPPASTFMATKRRHTHFNLISRRVSLLCSTWTDSSYYE